MSISSTCNRRVESVGSHLPRVTVFICDEDLKTFHIGQEGET